LISIGEVTTTQLDLLLSRIRRVFNTSKILLGDWGGPPMQEGQRDSDIVRADTAAALVSAVGTLTTERAANQPSRLELVKPAAPLNGNHRTHREQLEP